MRLHPFPCRLRREVKEYMKRVTAALADLAQRCTDSHVTKNHSQPAQLMVSPYTHMSTDTIFVQSQSWTALVLLFPLMMSSIKLLILSSINQYASDSWSCCVSYTYQSSVHFISLYNNYLAGWTGLKHKRKHRCMSCMQNLCSYVDIKNTCRKNITHHNLKA